MKNLHSLAAIVVAVAMVGCGGSSSPSGGTSTTQTNPTAPSSTHIEAVVSHLTTYDDGSQTRGIKFQYQDLATIQALDQIQFQLVYYTGSGQRVVLPTDQWTSSDSTNAYGTISFNSGAYNAANAVTPSPLSVEVTYNNRNYFAYYSVVPRQVRERGQVVSDSTKAGLAGIEVDFYGFSNISNDTPYGVGSAQDTAGNTYTEYLYPATPNTSGVVFLGRTTTQADGTFRASVPAGTYGFTLLNSTVPSGFQRIFRYRGQLYNTQDLLPLGLAPLPTPSPLVKPPTAPLPNPLPSPLGVYAKELPLLNNYLPNGEYFLANYGDTNPATNGTIELIPSSESVTAPTN